MKKIKSILTVIIAILLFSGILYYNVIGQNKKQLFNPAMIISGDTIYKNTPKTDIKVNKQYDEHGNLIQYDSSYTSYYSSEGQIDVKKIDSIFNNFKPFFFDNYPKFFNNPFDDFFFSDSLNSFDFFNNKSYFHNQFMLHDNLFDKIIEQLDSMKNQFYKQAYPNNLTPNNPNKIKKL